MLFYLVLSQIEPFSDNTHVNPFGHDDIQAHSWFVVYTSTDVSFIIQHKEDWSTPKGNFGNSPDAPIPLFASSCELALSATSSAIRLPERIVFTPNAEKVFTPNAEKVFTPNAEKVSTPNV